MDKALIFEHLLDTIKFVGTLHKDEVGGGIAAGLLSGNDAQLITGYPSPTFNMVRLDTENDALIKELKTHKIPFLCLPSVKMEATFESFATKHDMVKADMITASFYDNLQSFQYVPEANGISVRSVTTPEDLKDFDRISAVAFSHPETLAEKFLHPIIGNDDVRGYLAYFNGQPVVCGILSLVNQQAGLYWLGVLPEFRKQGVGIHLALHRMQVAQSLGFSSIVVQNMTPSLGIYRRLGFKMQGTLPAYVCV